MQVWVWPGSYLKHISSIFPSVLLSYTVNKNRYKTEKVLVDLHKFIDIPFNCKAQHNVMRNSKYG